MQQCCMQCDMQQYNMKHATCNMRCDDATTQAFCGASYNHPQMHHMDTACYTAFSDKTGDQSTLSTSDLSLT
jgi:hypothetical protein